MKRAILLATAVILVLLALALVVPEVLGSVLWLLLCGALVLTAMARRRKCKWDARMAKRRLIWGIVGATVIPSLAVISSPSLLNSRASVFGVAIIADPLMLPAWLGVYWIALALFRRRDLRVEEQANAAKAVGQG